MNEARAAIVEALSDPRLGRVIETVRERLSSPLAVMIQGGFLRNSVLARRFGIDFPSRDLDFVVGGLQSDGELIKRFEDKDPQPTTFGGVKLVLDGVRTDIWRAELQMQVAGHEPQPSPLPDILRYVTLTTDAVGYDLDTGMLHERGFHNAIRDRIIDAGECSNWLPRWRPFHVAHLAYVRVITGFTLSALLRQRLRDNLNPKVLREATEYLLTRKQRADATECINVLLSEMRS
jgi:hypothetical protein